jgi:CubicO group peptidase (beta-lactamase class C family)
MISALIPLAAASVLSFAQARTNDEATEKKVDAIATEFLAKPGAVGLSIGVGRKGELVFAKGYGLADAEFDVPANADTMFRIGSITKQFTSAAILRFVEEKKLSLDDTLEKLVPDFKTPGHTVTLRQLLNHTSGIPSYTDVGKAWKEKWPLELSDDELLALVADEPFDFEPGQDWRYNNTGYYLLGMVLAKTSGKTYAEHVESALFKPLGLTRTRYDSNSELIKNRAQGYRLEKGKLRNDHLVGMSQPGAAGGLMSTGGDLVRWMIALSSGRVVKPESFALMTTSTVLPSGRDTHYGFGLSIDEFAEKKCISHGGGIFGFNSMIKWIPEADLCVAVISNGEPLSSGKIADAIAYKLLGIERGTVKDEPTTPEKRAQLSGKYTFEDMPMDARVFEEDGRLKLQATGQSAVGLLWQGGNEFRADFDNDVRFVFAADAQTFTLYQNGGVFHAKRAP